MITDLEGCLKENGLSESCLSLFQDFTNEAMEDECTQSKLDQEGGLLYAEKLMKKCDTPVKKLLNFEPPGKDCFHFTGLLQLKCFARTKPNSNIN